MTMNLPNPLIVSILTSLMMPPIPAGYGLEIHPLVLAGWVGIIVTLLNLMPVAFLDGGHIVKSLFTEKIHRIISIIGVLITLALGWIPMAILMMLILVLNKRHTWGIRQCLKVNNMEERNGCCYAYNFYSLFDTGPNILIIPLNP